MLILPSPQLPEYFKREEVREREGKRRGERVMAAQGPSLAPLCLLFQNYLHLLVVTWTCVHQVSGNILGREISLEKKNFSLMPDVAGKWKKDKCQTLNTPNTHIQIQLMNNSQLLKDTRGSRGTGVCLGTKGYSVVRLADSAASEGSWVWLWMILGSDDARRSSCQ